MCVHRLQISNFLIKVNKRKYDDIQNRQQQKLQKNPKFDKNSKEKEETEERKQI